MWGEAGWRPLVARRRTALAGPCLRRQDQVAEGSALTSLPEHSGASGSSRARGPRRTGLAGGSERRGPSDGWRRGGWGSPQVRAGVGCALVLRCAVEVTGHRGGTEGSQGHLRRCWFLSCRGPELPPGARTALSSRTPVSPPPPLPHSPPEPRTWPDTALLMKAALHVTAAVEGGGRGGVAVNPGSGGGTQAGGRGGAGRGWGCREVQGPEHAGAQSQRGERPAGTERRQPSVPLTLCPWRGPGFPGAGSPWTSQPTGAPRRPGPRLASSTRPSLPPAQLPPRLHGLATWPVTPAFPLERVHPQSARPGPCTPHTPSEGPTLPLCPVSPAMSSERMLDPQGRAWGAGHFAGHPGGIKIA